MIKKRLFIAINLPEQVKRKLFEWELKLEQEYGLGEFRGRSINWVIRNNLHITLIFIGYATDDETYEIAKQMKEVAKNHKQFFINLEKIILGPAYDKSSAGKPPSQRMFWVQGGKSQELADLQNDLNEEIQQLGGTKYNAFRPHINLARFKSNVSRIIKEQGTIEKKINYQIPVESIDLMQSNLKRSGAEYIILERVNLGEK